MTLHTISFGRFLERGLPQGFMPQLPNRLASAYDLAQKAGRVSTDVSGDPHTLLPFLEQERLADTPKIPYIGLQGTSQAYELGLDRTRGSVNMCM